MTRKKLVTLASVLLLLAVLLLLRSFWNPDNRQPSESASPSQARLPRSNTEGGSGGRERDPILSKSAGSRPPEPFEASKEVAALLGNGAESDTEVVPRLMEFVGNSEKPLAARQEAMTHLLNLCSEAESESSLLELACRPQLAKELRTQILEDSLNHSKDFRGELLMFLLENPQLGNEGQAIEGLRDLTGEDLGNSPPQWREALKRLASKDS